MSVNAFVLSSLVVCAIIFLQCLEVAIGGIAGFLVNDKTWKGMHNGF